jgi:hypothetical protein
VRGRPSIEYVHVDCGLPASSKPSAVNEPVKLTTESMPGTPRVGRAALAACDPRNASRFAPCGRLSFKNDIGTRAASTVVVTACDVELDVWLDDDESTHPVTNDTKTSALNM